MHLVCVYEWHSLLSLQFVILNSLLSTCFLAELHLIYLRSRPDHPSVSWAPGLELLPRYRETSAPAEFSGKGLSVSGWSLLKRRYFIKFPVTNAVEADGIQIEISNEFWFSTFKPSSNYVYRFIKKRENEICYNTRLVMDRIPKLNNSSAERFPALVTGFFFLTWYTILPHIEILLWSRICNLLY